RGCAAMAAAYVLSYSKPSGQSRSLHDALPVLKYVARPAPVHVVPTRGLNAGWNAPEFATVAESSVQSLLLEPLLRFRNRSCCSSDRKSTRLNSSHVKI